MAKRTAGYWVSKLLRLSILFLLIVGAVDILVITQRSFNRAIFSSDRPPSEALQAPVSDYSIKPPLAPEQYDPFQYLGLAAAGPITDKKLSFEVKPAGVIARYDVSLPKDHVLLRAIQSGLDTTYSNLLVKDILGEVKLNTESLKFNTPEVVILENDPQGRFSVTSRNYIPQSQSIVVEIPKPAKHPPIESQPLSVGINTDQAQVWSGSSDNIPVLKTAERTLFVIQPGQPYFSFGIYLPNWTAPVEAPRETAEVTLADLINQSIRLPALGWLIIGLLEALPFFLTLIWARRYDFKSDQPEFERSVRIIGIYLAYHFLFFFFLAFSELTETWKNPAFQLVGYLQGRFPISIMIDSPKSTFVLLTMMATFFYIWPAFSIRRLSLNNGEETTTPRWRGYAAQSLYLILLIALVAGLSLFSHRSVLEMKSRWTNGSFFGLSLSVLLLLLFLLCTWLAFEIFDRRRPVAALLSFFLLTYLVLVEDNYWLNHHRKTDAAMTLVNFALAATVMVAAFGRLFYAIVTGQSIYPEWRTWSRQKKLLVVLGLLAVAFSTRSWMVPMRYWPLWSLAWQLKSFFYLALILILTRFLWSVSSHRRSLALPPSARIAGILLALSLFYSPVARWHYIPVCFLIGFLLLKKWLLPGKHIDLSVLSGIENQLSRVIKKIISFNDAEKALRLLKKELVTKIGKGELTYDGYTEKVEAQDRAVAGLKNDLTIDGHFAKELVLGLGPTDSAWENGKRASFYSLIFSLPWILLYLRNFVLAPAPTESYLILDLLNSFISYLLTWISYGFIFGYFYPYIIGKHGIQKGLAVFLTIVIPQLVFTSLVYPVDRASWQSFGFWTLQIFVHCMLLGLVAGDYEILRRAGFKFSDLLEIHKFSSLSAWASTVVVAISAAITTLISSGAAEVLSSVLKYMGVIPSELKLPTK